ncbi:MAG: hypothetical protein EOM15_16465 [Spirochaetia bacterium]|nr:hypothetical protein [Spirochaetia bacterium]
MCKKFLVLLVLLFCLSSQLFSHSKAAWDVGYDSTILSQGAAVRLSLGTFAVNTALQYSFSGVLVSALMQDQEVLEGFAQSFLVTAGITNTFWINATKAVTVGPKVYGLSLNLQRWVVGSLGLDVSMEFWNEERTQALVLGSYFPLVLYGEMVLSGNGGLGWAYDEFGFAASPFMGYWWRL